MQYRPRMVAIAEEQYVSLTTFTKDGRPKPAPVWIVDLGGGEVGFTTGGNSWKVKRINNTPKVTLQACDQRGNVRDGAPIVEGTARVATTSEFERISGLVKDKYGFMVTVIKAIGVVRKLFTSAEQLRRTVS